jgi:hypothetical protein
VSAPNQATNHMRKRCGQFGQSANLKRMGNKGKSCFKKIWT